jgi:hypothetical protein
MHEDAASAACYPKPPSDLQTHPCNWTSFLIGLDGLPRRVHRQSPCPSAHPARYHDARPRDSARIIWDHRDGPSLRGQPPCAVRIRLRLRTNHIPSMAILARALTLGTDNEIPRLTSFRSCAPRAAPDLLGWSSISIPRLRRRRPWPWQPPRRPRRPYRTWCTTASFLALLPPALPFTLTPDAAHHAPRIYDC